MLIAGLAASVVPAGVLIHRFGRRAVFVGSALQAAVGCVLAGYAISTGRYWLFCVGGVPARRQQCRRHAVPVCGDRVREAARASRAIAVVMSGALVAAWLGPELAVRTADLVPSAHYAGSFYAGSGLYLVAADPLSRIGGMAAGGAQRTRRLPRRLREIAAQPVFRVAVLAALASYTVMSFIMTATPISMHVVDGHDEVATARVIQVHLLGMYLPSLASGWIIAKFGDRPVIVAGHAPDGRLRRHRRLRRSRRPALRLGARACWASAGTCCSSRRRRC